MTPDPDGKAASNDPRGESGHSAEQRREYSNQLQDWLSQTHGIIFVNGGDDFSDESIIASPPSMDSLTAIARGVERLSDLGVTLPTVIKIDESLPSNAAAAYEFWSGDVSVPPDVDTARMERAVRSGQFSGTSADDLFVHEMSHHDHFRRLEEFVTESFGSMDKEDVKDKAHGYAAEMFGSPGDDGVPTADPWTPSGRFAGTAKNRAGKPLGTDEARDVALEVSQYAATNPLEFVAEVRTGIFAGARYSSEVMSLYEDYLGPAIVSPSRSAKRLGAHR